MEIEFGYKRCIKALCRILKQHLPIALRAVESVPEECPPQKKTQLVGIFVYSTLNFWVLFFPTCPSLLYNSE